MKKIIQLTIFILLFSACQKEAVLNERDVFKKKVEAFEFLSKYHHQLHIMIGEEEGDIDKAFKEFSAALASNQNIELVPVNNAIIRVKIANKDSEAVKRLDYLVDYYQSGLSMQVEAILRGYGYLESFSTGDALVIYDRVSQ